MATTASEAPPPAYQPTQPSFPEELPPRKLTQTWMQRNGFKAKTFFTLHYHSFSFRNRHSAADICRRTSMWIIMLARVVIMILAFLFFIYEIYLNVASTVLLVFLVLIGVVLLMVNTWCVALIGDAVGMRRALGMPVRRKGLDWFLHVMAFVHILGAATLIFWAFYGIAAFAVWFFLGIILLIVALMASTEPIDQYGIGGV